jgi:hypothetical protein
MAIAVKFVGAIATVNAACVRSVKSAHEEVHTRNRNDLRMTYDRHVKNCHELMLCIESVQKCGLNGHVNIRLIVAGATVAAF